MTKNKKLFMSRKKKIKIILSKNKREDTLFAQAFGLHKPQGDLRSTRAHPRRLRRAFPFGNLKDTCI